MTNDQNTRKGYFGFAQHGMRGRKNVELEKTKPGNAASTSDKNNLSKD